MTTKKEDTIRVLRVYEFTGPRSLVEAQVAKSIQGEKVVGNGLVIKAATIGAYPEILEAAKVEPVPNPRPVKARVEGAIRIVRGAEIAYLGLGPVDEGGPAVPHASHSIQTAQVFLSERLAMDTWASRYGSGEFGNWSLLDYEPVDGRLRWTIRMTDTNTGDVSYPVEVPGVGVKLSPAANKYYDKYAAATYELCQLRARTVAKTWAFTLETHLF